MNTCHRRQNDQPRRTPHSRHRNRWRREPAMVLILALKLVLPASFGHQMSSARISGLTRVFLIYYMMMYSMFTIDNDKGHGAPFPQPEVAALATLRGVARALRRVMHDRGGGTTFRIFPRILPQPVLAIHQRRGSRLPVPGAGKGEAAGGRSRRQARLTSAARSEPAPAGPVDPRRYEQPH